MVSSTDKVVDDVRMGAFYFWIGGDCNLDIEAIVSLNVSFVSFNVL